MRIFARVGGFLHINPLSRLLGCESCELSRLFYQRHAVEVILPKDFLFHPEENSMEENAVTPEGCREAHIENTAVNVVNL